MSEFQYYEFYSIDKELTAKERKEVDGLSSRFSPTSRRAIFHYSYSDFKHDVKSVLLDYFDFFLYLSNWGERRIMFKIPKDLIDYKKIQHYSCVYDSDYMGEGLFISQKSKYVLIDISISDSDQGYWIDEDNDLSSKLTGLRENLIEGDYRSLFIIWLHIKELEYKSEQIDLGETLDKNLIPPNLKKLNGNLKELMSFFDVNKDWVLGAANYSNKSVKEEINYEALLPKLSKEIKEDYLKKILAGEQNLTIQLKREIDSRFNQKKKKEKSKGTLSLEELVESVEKAKNKRFASEKKQAEKERLKKLKYTENNKEEILKEIDSHIIKGTAKSYDEALLHILVLKELAIQKGEEKEFYAWIMKLRKVLGRKYSMLRRLEDNNLC